LGLENKLSGNPVASNASAISVRAPGQLKSDGNLYCVPESDACGQKHIFYPRKQFVKKMFRLYRRPSSAAVHFQSVRSVPNIYM
jgi:hypothetical protein